MKIGVVTTGGTIAGSVIDNVVAAGDTSANATGLVDVLASQTELLFRSPLSVMSENMEPADWITIARAVHDLASEDVEGVLVLHGTDTAIFTCAALSFMCADVRVPVVVTGSNTPAGQPHSDALNNMLGAISAITNLEHGCFLSFAGDERSASSVFSGTRVRKLHAGGQPYRSVGAPTVAKVESDGRFELNPAALSLAESRPSNTPPKLLGVDTRVAMWTLYPGFDFRGLEYLVKERDYRSIVLQLYGSLSAPTGTDDVDCAMFVAWCKERDVTVIGCPHEPPLGNLLDYESTISLRESGMIIVPHTLPEVAYVKAVCLGSVAGDRDDLVERFLTPLAAEFYENHA